MRQTSAALGAAAAVAVLATAVAVAPQLRHQGTDHPSRSTHMAAVASFVPAGNGVGPTSLQNADARLTVAAHHVPGTIRAMLGHGEVGQILEDARFPLEDGNRSKVVHFLFSGAITTFVVEPAGSLGSCAGFARAGTSQHLRCDVVDGLETLTWSDEDGPDIPAHGVSVWQHGFVVSLVSYSNPRIDLRQPPISVDELTTLARSPIWFS
jgi:hypothetical protein